MTDTQRSFLTRLLTSYALFFLALHFFQYATPSRLSGPPLFGLGMDVTYWLYKLSGLPYLIVYNQVGAVIFDLLLFSSGVFVLFFPLRRMGVIVFSVLLSVYAITFNMFLMHHVHIMTGMMIVFVPFWFADNEKCLLLWQGVRYYTCYIYTMAFLWKTCIGNSFYALQQGSLTFKSNLVEYMYHNPDGLFTVFCRFCIRHEWLLNGGEKLVMLLEGLMVIGFFTKKWDKLLFWFPITIHVATYFFSDVMFLELLIIDFSLLSLRQLDWLRGWHIKKLRPASLL